MGSRFLVQGDRLCSCREFPRLAFYHRTPEVFIWIAHYHLPFYRGAFRVKLERDAKEGFDAQH